MLRIIITLIMVCQATCWFAEDVDYPFETDEPQKHGWPLTADERAYVVDRPEYERRPGRGQNKHLPAMWPVCPSAGHWGGSAWLDTHARLVDYVKANPGPVDILLVGDSITQQWGSPLDKGVFNEAWRSRFGNYKTLNIGIGGDKSQNVLWRLDHGGVDGIEPKLVVLMIGNNNMFFTPETGIEAAAKGVKMCVVNLHQKFPDAHILVAKILPCHAPGNKFYEDIIKTNAAIDSLELDLTPGVRVLDLTDAFLNPDGSLRKGLFTPDNIHLSPEGYETYAKRLEPIINQKLEGKGLGGDVVLPAAKNVSSSSSQSVPATREVSSALQPMLSEVVVQPTLKSEDGKSIVYPYGPYNDGKMDPQVSGWPLTAAELAWVSKGEYFRKPGHEVSKHLPEMWFVTPTAAHWEPGNGAQGNAWLDHHAACISMVQAAGNDIEIALLGDSITQGWGGGWDKAPFSNVWTKHFGKQKAVNLGIAGDRIENLLWRLDHGALDGASPKVIVLMIGVNNAPLVEANGVPAVSAAHGIKLCVDNLRMRCPCAKIVVVKLLPAFDPQKETGMRIREINRLLDALRLDADEQVRVLDCCDDFCNADGSLRNELYADGHLHPGPAGYAVLAQRLRTELNK